MVPLRQIISRRPVLPDTVSVDPLAFHGCRPTSVFDLMTDTVEKRTENEVCTICLDILTDRPSCQLTCSHLFHVECAKEWYRTNDTCANCRGDINSWCEL